MQTAKTMAAFLWVVALPVQAQSPMPTMPSMHMQHESSQHSPATATGLPGDVASRTPLRLAHFLDLADRDSPTLRQAASTVQHSEALARQAAMYPNPTIGYEGDQIRGGSYGGGEQGGFVEQTVVLGGKLGLRSQVYQLQAKANTAAVETVRTRVRADVTQMFYSALSAQQTVAVRARLLALAQDAVDTSQQLANVGQADAPDVLQAEVEADQADIDFTAAQHSFVEHFRQLAAFSGSPETLVAPLDGDLEAVPEVDAEHVVQTMVEQSPAVREAQQNVLVAEARVKQAKREIVPDLQLKAGEQANHEALDSSPGRQTGAQSFAAASLELPLWNHNQGNVRAAEIELEQAREEVRRTQLAVREDGEGLVERYTSAKLEATRYRTAVLPKARRAYELYQEKYQRMAQAYPLVIVSQRTLFELEMRSIEALDRTWQNAIALENFGLRDGLGKLPSDH